MLLYPQREHNAANGRSPNARPKHASARQLAAAGGRAVLYLHLEAVSKEGQKGLVDPRGGRLHEVKPGLGSGLTPAARCGGPRLQ